MQFDRRHFLGLSGALAITPWAAGATTGLGEVIDMTGRAVALDAPPRRIVLLDAVDILSMAVLHPDPSSLVVGWAGVDRFDSELVRRQYEKRPDGSTIPRVGGQTADTVSVERILALEPDLVVTTTAVEPEGGEGSLTRRLETAGIPVVFSNAASNRPPARETGGALFDDSARTLRLWGAVLEQQEQAEAFIDFVGDRLARITDRLASTPPTKAYLEVQSTYDDCCWAAGRRVWGDLLTLAGGRNLAAVDAPWYAKVATEQLITEAPAVYIASGGAFGAGIRPGIGPGLDPAAARAGLRRLTARTGFDTLPAVRDGRVHGVWTGLLTVPPLNILFVEIAAQWLNPQAFKDTDPAETLNDINRRFLAKPLAGPCWLSLPPP